MALGPLKRVIMRSCGIIVLVGGWGIAAGGTLGPRFGAESVEVRSGNIPAEDVHKIVLEVTLGLQVADPDGEMAKW
jgi:hypothetical protein